MNIIVSKNAKLTVTLAERLKRRPSVRASLACEGIYLAAEEEALVEKMDREGLSPDQRARRIISVFNAPQRQAVAPSE